jgi:hypothetical protein
MEGARSTHPEGSEKVWDGQPVYPLAVWWRRLALAMGCSLREALGPLQAPFADPDRLLRFQMLSMGSTPGLLVQPEGKLTAPDGAPYFEARRAAESECLQAGAWSVRWAHFAEDWLRLARALDDPTLSSLATIESVPLRERSLGLTEASAFAIWPVLRTYTGPIDAEPPVGTLAQGHQASAENHAGAAEPYRPGTRKLTLTDEEVLERIEAMGAPGWGRNAKLARDLGVDPSTVSKAIERARSARRSAAAEAAASTAGGAASLQVAWHQRSNKSKG